MLRGRRASILIDVTTTTHIVIGLELEQTDECLSGRLVRGDGTAISFAGWLGLTSALDAVLRSADETGESGGDPSIPTPEGDIR